MKQDKFTMWMFVIFVIVLIVGYWYQHRQRDTDRPLTDQDVVAEMQSRAQRAVADAKAEYDVDLDFSPDSIESLESILEQVHQSHMANPIPDTELTRYALKWGGYLGEVIKQVQTAEWKLNSQINGEGSLPIVYEDESESFPVAWCHKRIVNGDEDNVWTKFTILVVHRDANLDEGIPSMPLDPASDEITTEEAESE